MRHRPIGIGVQGLADAFLLMRYPFESREAQQLNTDIFETIYYAALKASCEFAERFGPYETYAGSPVSQGVSFHVFVSSYISPSKILILCSFMLQKSFSCRGQQMRCWLGGLDL